MLVRLDLLGLVSDNTHELANERITPLLNIRVFESVNTTNPNKGGVAIISLDPNIDMKLEDADYHHCTNWITEMPQAKRDAVDKEAAIGR